MTAKAAKATHSQRRQNVDPMPPSLMGSGKTAICHGDVCETGTMVMTTSGVSSARRVAPMPSPRPVATPLAPSGLDDSLVSPQHELWRDEEEWSDCLLRACSTTAGRSDTSSTGSAGAGYRFPPIVAFSSWRTRWLAVCGRRLMAALNFAWSAAVVTVTSFLALLAVAIFFWALSPVRTSCVRSSGQLSSSVVPAADEQGTSTLYINQLQVIGTHNSYHRRTFVPALSDYWDYQYPSLTAQLDAGIRHLELDTHYDWKTGRWFVFHLSILDAVSSCNCLSVCLAEIREWSDTHPTHHILFIEIEFKLTGDFLQLCGEKTPGADHTAFRAMQETVIDEFPLDRILTPREVRGDYETLAEAVTATTSASELFVPTTTSSASAESSGSGGVAREGTAGGWPLVDETRGKVLFIIDYQTTNILCRPSVRKALPKDETVFFERTPLTEIGHSDLLTFVETRNSGMIDGMVRSGIIVRNRIPNHDWDSRSDSEEDGDEPRLTYVVDTPAQLVVYDDLRVVQHGNAQQEEKDGVVTPLRCRSRCSAIVPEEQCVLEGFC
ncbi:unnamed protein product [Ectocarpus sp. CCAP 1310/34]|nr:unnamed protein product [Ectocarpus sp. CCAP 1310/34]